MSQPALMRRVEDWAYQLGRKCNVMVIVPLIEKTLDDGVWRLRRSRQKTEDDVVEAVKSTLPRGHDAVCTWHTSKPGAVASI